MLGQFGFAADLPSRRAPPPAPYISPVPVATWTGFYIGVNAGATFSGSSIIALTPSSDFGPFPSGFASAQAIGAYHTSLTTRRTSFIGGGQVGFNYQFGMLVPAPKPTFRLCRREAPYRRRFNPAPPPANFSAPVFGTATVAPRLDYLGTPGGRLGGCPLVLRCSMQRAVWLTAAPILPIPGRSASPSHRRSSSAARPPTAEPASVTRSAAASNTPSGKTGPSRRSILLQSRPSLDDD